MAVGHEDIQDTHGGYRRMSQGACVGRRRPGGQASRTIVVGDIIKVRKPPVTFTFRVKALTENRLGARLVPEYLENLTPKSEYDLLEVVKISGFVDRQKGLGRPTKREGRELSRFTESIGDDGWDFDFDFDDDTDE